MFNSKLFIFSCFFLILGFGRGMVQNQTNPQPCSAQQKESYVSFYQKNFKDYDLFLANVDFRKLKCYFQVFLVEGMNRTVIWADFPEETFPNYGNLYISHSNPSEFPTFEENLEIPLLSGSLNEILLQEKAGSANRSDRVSKFLVPIVREAFDDFQVDKKKDYFDRMFLMNRMNLDKLMNNLVADFFGNFVEKQQGFIASNWKEDLAHVVLSQGADILAQLLIQFQNKLDSKVANSTYKKVNKNFNFVQAEFKFILEMLKVYAAPDGNGYGRNYLGQALNKAFYPIGLGDLQNFYNDFLVTIDKKLDLDFNFEVEGQNEGEQFSNLLQIMQEIPVYQIQFFVYEKFELIGLKRGDTNSKSFMSMSRTPQDNCGLTLNKKTEFLNLGVTEKVLNESILKAALISIYVRCEKSVNNNLEFFKLILKPDQDQECEMIVLQKDLGSGQFETQILLDTFPIPKKYVSCMRYVRGVLQRQNYILI